MHGRPEFGCLLALLLLSGCIQTPKQRATLPARHEAVREQLVFHSDVSLPVYHRLLSDLTVLRTSLSQELLLPVSDEPIHVYVFEDADRFYTFLRLHHPDLPRRRAFFLERDTRLEVYTQWGDRVAEDLRHEVTHAYLHAVIQNLPLWLDEGLAEYYELPRGCCGVNRPHVNLLLERLKAGTWRPDLPRLEGFDTAMPMTQVDYAESWAWVHLMLHGEPSRKQALCEYVRQLHTTGQAPPLWSRIGSPRGDPCRDLIDHLRRLAEAAN